MNTDLQTRRRPPRGILAVLAVITIALLVWGIVQLERDRAQRLLRESVRLYRTEDGRILQATFHEEVTPQQWGLITNAPSLSMLDLSHTTSVPGGLSSVAAFPNLHTLSLSGCRWVNDDEIAKIASLTQLQELNLSNTPITDAGLQTLNLPHLHTLTADFCFGLSDDSIKVFSRIESLRWLNLKNVPLSLEAVEALRYKRPDLRILANPKLSWEFVDQQNRYSPLACWITDRTDLDQLIRYHKLPHNWHSGEFKPDAAGVELLLAGPGVGKALPVILPEFPTLESLTVMDAMLKGGLENLPVSLKNLSLERLHPQSRLDGIESLNALEYVSLHNSDLSAGQWARLFSAIAASRSLQWLYLSDVDIPSGSFRKLLDHPQLTTLILSHCNVADDDLVAVGSIRSLQHIDVVSVAVRDVSVENWFDLPMLKSLNLNDVPVSSDMAGLLQQQYPQAQISVFSQR